MSARALTDARMLRLPAASLLVGGPLLGLFYGPLGMAAVVFGVGAIHLGQVRANENRGGLIGIALMLSGASTVVDAAIWTLLAARF